MKLHIAGTGHATVKNNYNTSFVVAFWKKIKIVRHIKKYVVVYKIRKVVYR